MQYMYNILLLLRKIVHTYILVCDVMAAATVCGSDVVSVVHIHPSQSTTSSWCCCRQKKRKLQTKKGG